MHLKRSLTLKSIRCHFGAQNLDSFRHSTVARQIHAELLFSTAEKPPTVFTLSQLQGGAMPSLSFEDSATSLVCHTQQQQQRPHLVFWHRAGRDNPKRFQNISCGSSTIWGKKKKSLSIVPFVLDWCSFPHVAGSSAPSGEIYWRLGLNADVHGWGLFSRGARGHSDDVWEEMRKTSTTFSFLPPLHHRSRRPPHNHNARSFILLFVVRDGILLPTGSGSCLWSCRKHLSVSHHRSVWNTSTTICENCGWHCQRDQKS